MPGLPIVFRVTQLITGWWWSLAAVSLLAITSQYHLQNAQQVILILLRPTLEAYFKSHNDYRKKSER
jgi:hypothetical protein